MHILQRIVPIRLDNSFVCKGVIILEVNYPDKAVFDEMKGAKALLLEAEA